MILRKKSRKITYVRLPSCLHLTNHKRTSSIRFESKNDRKKKLLETQQSRDTANGKEIQTYRRKCTGFVQYLPINFTLKLVYRYQYLSVRSSFTIKLDKWIDTWSKITCGKRFWIYFLLMIFHVDRSSPLSLFYLFPFLLSALLTSYSILISFENVICNLARLLVHISCTIFFFFLRNRI